MFISLAVKINQMLILAILLRIISNPFSNVLQKRLAATLHPLLVNLLSYSLLSVFCIFIAVNVDWEELPAEFWIYSALMGLVSGAGDGFIVKALRHGELSVLGPINAYKSIVGIVIGIFLLGELPSWPGLLGVVLIICGSYFVLDTMEERFSWSLFKKREIQYRLLALVLTGIGAVFLKKVIIHSSTLAAFISWSWFGTLFSVVFYMLDRKKVKRDHPISVNETYSFLLLAACIGIMQYTTNYVIEHMQVGYALALFQLSIIVSVFFGHAFFKEGNVRRKLIGSLIMIVGSCMIILW
jgi:drug/metabolite transporter (DMT)-like permease